MADSQISEECSDFEVLPKQCLGGDNYMSIASATSGDGDPYEKRSDIIVTRTIVQDLRKTLNFQSEEKIDELREKLKSRDALDAGIGDEFAALDDLSRNNESQQLEMAIEQAKEYVAKVRNLAIEKKTTVKRALDILEISLPIFIMANDLSKDDERLSDEVAILQEEYEDTKKEIIRCQEEFEMEKRKETLKHGKALLKRTISAASEDHQRINDQLSAENASANLKKFSQAQNDVELIIGTERDELDAWLMSCKGDYENIESTIKEQLRRHDEATRQYTSRIRNIDVNLEVNRGRQADLMKQLDGLKKEEKRLEDNRCFERQVQERAENLNTEVLQELESLREKITSIQDNASTAQEIMLNMQLCSDVMFDKAFEIQRVREEKLRQLKMEALIRERNALSSAAVEFKLQMHMAEDNIAEYQVQLEGIRKEIERAAKKGQSITVTRKKRDLEEYEQEIVKEREVIKENDGESEYYIDKLVKVDEELQAFGVSSPSFESLLQQKMKSMHLDSIGPSSLVSM